jgi:hypothetical protein
MSQSPTEHRKLAAIMFTDMVGYSAQAAVPGTRAAIARKTAIAARSTSS